MMTCCKEKAVFVAVYEEKPRKRRLTTKNNNNIKHHHHHHHHYHHHHLQVHGTNNGEGNDRKAKLLSYSKHLRESSKSQASISPKRPKSLVASTTKNVQQTITPVSHVEEKQKLKKQSSCLDINNMFKCFAMSQAKRKVKKTKKENNESPAKKASVIMKKFNARTQKGTRRFFSKLMASIQKYR